MRGRSVEAALNKFRPRPLKDEMKIRAKRPGQSIPFVHCERTFLVPAQDQDQNGEEKLPKKGKPPLAKKNLNECMQKLTFFFFFALSRFFACCCCCCWLHPNPKKPRDTNGKRLVQTTICCHSRPQLCLCVCVCVIFASKSHHKRSPKRTSIIVRQAGRQERKAKPPQ